VFCALNSTLRRQRRRLVMLAVMLGLAGAVVTTHSAMSHDHIGEMSDVIVMCVAVAQTAAVAVGVALALALGAWLRRPLWLIAAPGVPARPLVPATLGVHARAGPPLLQVFRL